MKISLGFSTLELAQGDITEQEVDAIVNAANAKLSGGGGVDGAIHKAGGPAIMNECRKLGGCPTGQAVATTAGALEAKHVIHAVGPIYKDGMQGEAELLSGAYMRAFELAVELGHRTIATPSISTGAYGYPMDEAARVALGATVDFLATNPGIKLIRFVLPSPEAFSAYSTALVELAPTQRIQGT